MDSPLTSALGWSLLHFLWQGMAIAAIAWVLLRIFRSSAARHLVAIIALALMPLSFAATAISGYQSARPFVHTPDGDLVWRPSGPFAVGPDPSSRVIGPRTEPQHHKSRSTGLEKSLESPSVSLGSTTGSSAFTPVAPSFHDVLTDWLPFVVMFWLAGVVFLSIRLLGGWSAARKLVGEAAHPAGTEYQQMFDRLVQRLKVSRAVRLLESTVAEVPSVVGWLRPVILLPATALTGLTPAQIELLLAHELAHVRRHDYLVNLLQCVVETLLFYHPAIWWLSQRAREERELCCDDIAVALTGDARRYAEALVALERMRAVPQLAMAATGGALLPRIKRLVDPDSLTVEIFPRWIAGGLVVSLLAGGAISAGLPRLDPMGLPSSDPGSAKPAAVEDTSHKTDQYESKTVGTIVAAPDTLISHPDPSRPLAERMAWAKSQNGRRPGTYWVAYSVRPIESIHGAMYIGSATMFTDDGKHFSSGSMVAFGDAGKIHAPGAVLQSLLGGRPDDVAILMSFDGDRLDDPAAVSLSLNFDFHGRPVYWLGSSDDTQSIALIRELLSRAQTKDQREKLVRLIGAHRSNELVIPILIGILESGEAPEVRDDAAAWLGRHPRKDALSALDRAARRDRSRDVRKEAAEAVGEMELPEAFDVLVKLARELDDAEVRQEAVEALGDRPEAEAAKVLGEIALHDRDRKVQREATETLGDLSDARGLIVLKDLVIHHPVSEVRQEAVETWADAAPVDQAVDLLAVVIRDDPSQDVRREAVEDLIELRDGKGLAIAKTIAREHRDPELRREAVEDLAPHLPTEEAIGFLKEVIARDPSTDVKREAVETLGELKDNRTIPVLVEVAQSQTNEDVAREAAETLGEINDPAAVEALERIARNHPSDEVMAEAVETLGERKSGDALKVVADIAATHPRSRVRAEAVETYGEYASGEDALALFKKLAATERDEHVLSEIFETAIELKGADGVAFVMEVVKHSRDTYVRDAAADELKDSDDRRAKALLRELKLDD